MNIFKATFVTPFKVVWGCVSLCRSSADHLYRFIQLIHERGKKPESPHGKAEVATDKMLKVAGHFEPDGFLAGYTASGKAIYTLDERNVLLMAYPGSGKSQTYIAYLRSLKHRPFERLPHLVIGDATNELFRNTATTLQEYGIDVSKIDLQQPDRWNSYDPLVELDADFKQRFSFNRRLTALCELVIEDEPSSRQPHFVQFARLLLKCVITVNVKYEGNNKTFGEIIEELLDEDKRAALVKRIKPYDDTVVQTALKTMQSLSEKPEGLSMLTTSLRKLEGFLDPAIREAMTAKPHEDGTFSRGWSFKEVLVRPTPTAIFLRTGMEKNGGDFARIVYGCFVNAIGEILTESDAALPRRAEALVDEGGLTGYCNAFVKGYSRYRKAGLRLRMSFVSYSELMSTYGDDGKTLWDGFNIIGFGGGNGMELNHKLSELSGRRTIFTRSGNQSSHGESSGWSESGIPLFSAHDIRDMGETESLLILDRLTARGTKTWRKVKGSIEYLEPKSSILKRLFK